MKVWFGKKNRKMLGFENNILVTMLSNGTETKKSKLKGVREF